MNRFVYVIGVGERGEGQEPRAATSTLAQAKRLVLDTYDTGVERAGQGKWIGWVNPPVDEVWIHRVEFLGGGAA